MKKLILAAVAAILSLSASAFSTDTLTLKSSRLPEPMRVTVITPEIAKQRDNLPVVYLLNGYGGDYRSWGIIRPDLGHYADHYGMVLVMPSGMDSWYWDSPEKPNLQMESFFVDELVPYITRNYPVSERRELRAINGLSMGGHGSLWLATRHPDIWGNAGSTSGGVDIVPFKEKWKMKQSLGTYDSNPERWAAHTVTNMVPQIKEANLNLIIDCGSEDFFSGVNADLHRKLLDAKVPHDYTSRPGVHNAKYWANSLLYTLLFFHENFKKNQ